MVFEIVQVAHDAESVRVYVDRYKAFRLLSLKVNPESFGSNLARELAFTDETWYSRLANPSATTFLTLQADKVICLLTAMGPLPCTPEELPVGANAWEIPSTDPLQQRQLHLRFNGMFTLPEARGQGVAAALIKRVVEWGIDEAERVSKTFVASLAVDDDNPAALALYTKCGFEPFKEEAFGDPSKPRVGILMKYSPAAAEGKAEV